MPQVDYHSRIEAKRERLELAADRAASRAASAYKRADMSEEATGIPFGQPILVGHHSEGRHRAAIKRADNAMRTSIEEGKKADYYASRAEGLGTHGVSSDDPDGIEKLTEKLAKLEASQTMMGEANKLARKRDITGLVALGLPLVLATQICTVPSWGGKFRAFEPYQLSNNSAVIRSTKQRIESLKAVATIETKTVETNVGVTLVENAEANRVQLVFGDKPNEETRKMLKGYGFRWSPTEGAWQRLLNNAGRWAAKCAIDKITEAVA